MQGPPIPQRIPPLAWRKPALLWTPVALALAIAGPLAAFRESDGLANTILIAGAFAYAAALTTLGVAWAFGRAPRSRREVLAHVLVAGAGAALGAPYVLTRLLGVAAPDGGDAFTLAMALSVTPLAIVLGLPIALISGLAFALVALERPSAGRADDAKRVDATPFR